MKVIVITIKKIVTLSEQLAVYNLEYKIWLVINIKMNFKLNSELALILLHGETNGQYFFFSALLFFFTVHLTRNNYDW